MDGARTGKGILRKASGEIIEGEFNNGEPVKKEPAQYASAGSWSYDSKTYRLTISGDLGQYNYHHKPFKDFQHDVRSIVALKGARIWDGSDLFAGMICLCEADLTELDVSSCKSMSGMFSGCISLTSLDLSTWDISNVYSMRAMFKDCYELKSIKTGPMWNPKNVRDSSSMFIWCGDLQDLDMVNWPGTELKSCDAMFNHCGSLTHLDLHSMSVGAVKNFDYMFVGCKNLRTLNLSGWNTYNAEVMDQLFAGCKRLETLDLSGWRMTGRSAEKMFSKVPKTARVIANDESIIKLLPDGIRV
ncbi:MAG: BspA family leucine-rich repeat surface protein, partial [Firmicutes bacterium]|nr:BspA family leucine-rich repeat surface protein [Bacillota bacterium]